LIVWVEKRAFGLGMGCQTST
jgi:hypothetical protein